MMTDKPLLISLMKKAENFAYHSFKYLDDDVQVDTVLLNTPDIVLLKKEKPEDGPTEYLWATNDIEHLINALQDIHQALIKFVPEAWVSLLLQHGFVTYGVLRDYWLNEISGAAIEEKQMDFATINDAKVISDLTKSNRCLSREFLGEEPKFINLWLTKDRDGTNSLGCKDTAIIIEKHHQEIIGVVFVGVYGHDSAQGPILWVRELAVHPNHHGQGIGRRLMEKALSYGALHGAVRSFLMADDLNVRAIHLYESLGYIAKVDEAQIDMLKV